MEPIEGWTAALRWGAPAERDYAVPMSRESFDYWQMVRRKREAEVVPVIRRRNGLYLVHTKAFYPQGVYRLLTGGIKPGEPLLDALAREAQEETSLTLRIERFDVASLAASVADAWFNQTLCRVNDCVVRLGVFKGGEFHWHKHDTEDEVFFVLSGRFVVELADRRVELGPQQGFVVPHGVLHKTSAAGPTTILMIEAASVDPTGD